MDPETGIAVPQRGWHNMDPETGIAVPQGDGTTWILRQALLLPLRVNKHPLAKHLSYELQHAELGGALTVFYQLQSYLLQCCFGSTGASTSYSQTELWFKLGHDRFSQALGAPPVRKHVLWARIIMLPICEASMSTA
eukprot:1161929-Pelagomonas_calceolata.AAC.3